MGHSIQNYWRKQVFHVLLLTDAADRESNQTIVFSDKFYTGKQIFVGLSRLFGCLFGRGGILCVLPENVEKYVFLRLLIRQVRYKKLDDSIVLRAKFCARIIIFRSQIRILACYFCCGGILRVV